MDIAYDGTHIVFKNLTTDVPITIQTTQVKTRATIDSTDGCIFNTDSKTLTTADNKLLFVTYGQPEPEPEPEKDAHLIEIFENFTIQDLTNSKSSIFGMVGSIITADDFVEKLNTDLQTTITYHDGFDLDGDKRAHLSFDDITGVTTLDISGIPISIFDETEVLGMLLPIQGGHRHMTLTADNNKLYFKYLTIPSDMTVTKGGSVNSVIKSDSMFVHEFIHKLEDDLDVKIALDSHTDPDTLVFDIDPNQLNPHLFTIDFRELNTSPLNTYVGFEGFNTSGQWSNCLLYTSPSPRDYAASRMPSSA